MIVFRNDDLIPVEAFTTFGVNAKPNHKNPIGYFGTGLKYAIAVILRLGGKITIFRGNEEYVFFTKDIDFRGKEFTTIRMKKRRNWKSWQYHQLPFTTELGKNWLPWMAYRELESNVRDENGESWQQDEDVVECDNNQTVIAVECKEIEDVYLNQVVFMPPNGGLVFENDYLQVFYGQSKHIFYRGLRIRDLHLPSAYTYNFKNILQLTEDRTSSYPHYDDTKIVNAWVHHDDSSAIESLISLEEDQWYEGRLPFDDLTSMSTGPTFSTAVSARVRGGQYVPSRMLSYFKKSNIESETKIKISLRKVDIEEILYWAQTEGKDVIARDCIIALRDLDVEIF